ncbi:MAG: hypothetical protein LBM67_05670 [Lentimicrobiaceae bacterium]|nr:hypothetical protein [Lentimicrobiaceae bacterium]
MNHYKLAALSLTLLFLSVLFQEKIAAQTHNEHVTIEGTFRPQVKNFDKINAKPENTSIQFEPQSFQIRLLDRNYNKLSKLETISPLRLQLRENKIITKNFLMAGFGTRLSPVFLYRHHSNLSDATSIGVGIKHFSTWTDALDDQNSTFMNNKFDVEIGNNFSTHNLNTKLEYKYDSYYYNDLRQNTIQSVASDTLKQNYQNIGLQSVLSSSNTDFGYLQHEIGLKFNYLFDKFGAKETNIRLDAKLIDVFDWFNYNGDQALGADLAFDYFDNKNKRESNNEMLFHASPYLRLQGDFYRLKIGLTFNYKTEKDPHFRIYPAIIGNLFVFDNDLEFYAGVDGGMRRICYTSLVGENPFVSSVLPLTFENTTFRFEGGVRSSAIQNVDLQAGIRFSTINNMPFYVADATTGFKNSMTLLYDNVKLFNFLVDFAWHHSSKFNVEGSFKLNNYSMDKLENPWYKPNYELTLEAFYNINDRLKANLGMVSNGKKNVLYLTSIDEKSYDYETKSIKAWIDLQVGADYNINELFSVYAQCTNLLNKKYELFDNYPVYGIQLFGGIKVRF